MNTNSYYLQILCAVFKGMSGAIGIEVNIVASSLALSLFLYLSLLPLRGLGFHASTLEYTKLGFILV
jgi:hypothetical protein